MAGPTTERPADDRPELCRDRLADEGKTHPKSGCQVQGCEPLTGLQICTGRDRAIPAAPGAGSAATGRVDGEGISLPGGWSFAEASLRNGVRTYALVSPTAVTFSDEWSEVDAQDFAAALSSGAAAAGPAAGAVPVEPHDATEEQYDEAARICGLKPTVVRIAYRAVSGVLFDKALAAQGEAGDGFQARNAAWMAEVMRDDPTDLAERVNRFGEEALELGQSLGQTAAEAHALVDYVHGRPKGDPAQEVGGTMTTLALLCTFADIDMEAAGEAELARCSTPEIRAKIREKRLKRHGRGPLPGTYAPDFTPAPRTGREPSR